MANDNIDYTLRLKDSFTMPMRRASQAVSKLDRQINALRRNMHNLANGRGQKRIGTNRAVLYNPNHGANDYTSKGIRPENVYNPNRGWSQRKYDFGNGFGSKHYGGSSHYGGFSGSGGFSGTAFEPKKARKPRAKNSQRVFVTNMPKTIKVAGFSKGAGGFGGSTSRRRKSYQESDYHNFLKKAFSQSSTQRMIGGKAPLLLNQGTGVNFTTTANGITGGSKQGNKRLLLGMGTPTNGGNITSTRNRNNGFQWSGGGMNGGRPNFNGWGFGNGNRGGWHYPPNMGNGQKLLGKEAPKPFGNTAPVTPTRRAKKLTGSGSNGLGMIGKIAMGTLISNTIQSVMAGISNTAKSIFNETIKDEDFGATIKALLGGDSKRASLMKADLVKFSRDTPFDLDETERGTKQLLAYGFQTDEVIESLTTLGNISAGVSKPLGDLTYLYGTLKTQGRAYTRDIWQFTNAGINLLPELAKQFGLVGSGGAELKKLIKDGAVGFEHVKVAFQNMTAEGGLFFDMMNTKMDTLGGKTSKLGESWQQLQRKIGESQRGILVDTVDWMTDMSDVLTHSLKTMKFAQNALGRFRYTSDEKVDNAGATGLGKLVKYVGGGAVAGLGWLFGQENAWDKNVNQKGERISEAIEGSFGVGTRIKRNKDFIVGLRDKFKQPETPVQQRKTDLELAKLQIKNKAIWKSGKQNEKDVKDDARDKMLFIKSLRTEFAETLKAKQEEKRISDLKRKAVAGGSPVTSKADTESLKSGSSKGVTGKRPQSIHINIDKLIKDFNLSTVNMTESIPAIKEMVSQALLEAVNDINTIQS